MTTMVNIPGKRTFHNESDDHVRIRVSCQRLLFWSMSDFLKFNMKSVVMNAFPLWFRMRCLENRSEDKYQTSFFTFRFM